MANRRMFSLDVVDTDNFLEMPASTQSLYFHLGMRADDDGFVAAPKKITKLVNCGEDDLKLLLAKGYILALENGVIVVRHWKQNNYIQRDRYKSTIYQKEFEKLTVESGIYGMDTGCIQDVSKLEAQVSIGKYSIDNNICSPGADERESDFEKIYAIYPKKRGKTKAFSNYCSWLKGRAVNGKRRKLTNREMYLAVHNYIRQQEAAGTELEYYKNFDTLTGNQLLDYVKEEQNE